MIVDIGCVMRGTYGRHVALIRIVYGAAALTTSIVIVKALYERARQIEEVKPSKNEEDDRTPNSLLCRIPINVFGSLFFSTTERVKAIAAHRKENFQLAIHRTLNLYLDKALDTFALKLKGHIKDEDMPECFQIGVSDAVDNIMPDLKMEIFRKADKYLIRQIHSIEAPRYSMIPSEVELINNSIFGRARGFILYHLFPYDKTIWGCFKDPYWYTFTCVGLMPYIGQVWWLYLFCIKDKSDEHLLCQFIIAFKSAQFLNMGIFCCIFGVFKYIRCTMAVDLGNMCINDGPSVYSWDAIFFFIQIVLVWISFSSLPYSTRVERKTKTISGTTLARNKSSSIKTDWFGTKIDLSRGGHLFKLFGYETICTSIVLALGLSILAADLEEWQAKSLLYWIRTFYGLLSFPFLLFKIPVVCDILTHTEKMGYDVNGLSICSSRSKKQHATKAATMEQWEIQKVFFKCLIKMIESLLHSSILEKETRVQLATMSPLLKILNSNKPYK